jgi:hypothetical protein
MVSTLFGVCKCRGVEVRSCSLCGISEREGGLFDTADTHLSSPVLCSGMQVM